LSSNKCSNSKCSNSKCSSRMRLCQRASSPALSRCSLPSRLPSARYRACTTTRHRLPPSPMRPWACLARALRCKCCRSKYSRTGTRRFCASSSAIQQHRCKT
ncbi:hypothetical protein GGH16_004574, partial [Coemansia sp. RSA 560]